MILKRLIVSGWILRISNTTSNGFTWRILRIVRILSKYVFADTHIDEFASSLCGTISNYTTAYDLDRTVQDGKCTENAYLKAKHMFDEEKTTREKSLSDWEKRALISVVAAYGILLIAAFTISARCITLENKESRGKRTDSIIKHNTAASVVCSFIAFAFGICILVISLGYFLWLKDSLFYVYAFLSVGLYGIYAAFSALLLAPLQVDADKSTMENASKFQRCVAYAAYIRETYKQKFGVAGEWFLHAAIIKELVEVSLQTRGLFRYARTQDALITAASCSTLALNCLLSPYGYVRQRKDAVIFCDGICDILYTVISATRIVARDAPISVLDALLLLFPIVSIITILNSYAVFSIKAKSSDKSNGISRGMSKLLRLPSSNFSRSNSAQKVYKLLLALFFFVVAQFAVYPDTRSFAASRSTSNAANVIAAACGGQRGLASICSRASLAKRRAVKITSERSIRLLAFTARPICRASISKILQI